MKKKKNQVTKRQLCIPRGGKRVVVRLGEGALTHGHFLFYKRKMFLD